MKTLTKIVVIVIILIALSVMVYYIFNKKSTTEGYTSLDASNQFKNIRPITSQPSAGSVTETEIARVDREYVVVFPVSSTMANYASNFFSGSITTNWSYSDIVADARKLQSDKNTGQDIPTILNVWPITNLRECNSYFYPLLFSDNTTTNNKGAKALNITMSKTNSNLIQSSLSKSINDYYLKASGNPGKTVVTVTTDPNICGDIWPLSSADSNSAVNPYAGYTQGNKLYSARNRNSLLIEQVTYDPSSYPSLGQLRVEINKCSPVVLHSTVYKMKVTGWNADDSAVRIYSNPAGGHSDVGIMSNGYYLPSRFQENFALLKPKLSIMNIFFATDKGFGKGTYTSSASTPLYSNVDGVEGSSISSYATYYDLKAVWHTNTTYLSSQSFNIPDGASYLSGIAPTILLNPYIPVQKSGSGIALCDHATATGIADRSWWYSKVVQGRTRAIAQARQCSNTGTISYVFDSNGYILWVEPIRFFNLQRNLGNIEYTFPEVTTYYKADGTAGDTDRRPAESYGNVREGISSQSYPILCPASLIRDYVSLDNSNLDNCTMTFGDSSMGTSAAMQIAVRSVNNVFFDIDSSVINSGELSFSGFSTLIGGIINKIKASNETQSNSKIWKLPIGGFEFINVSDTRYDLYGGSFTDFTNRTFSLAALNIGSKHSAISKSAANGSLQFQNFIVNAYTHNYYYPWVSNQRTKYIVIENCNASTKAMVALNIKISKYNSSAMDPDDVSDISADSIFCYYSGCGYDSEYAYNSAQTSSNGMPINKLLDYGYNYPDYHNFSTDKGSWNTYPLIGSPYFNLNETWAKDSNYTPSAAGNIAFDSYMLRQSDGSSNIAHFSSTLLDHRGYTNSKTVIIVLNEPVFISSISYVSRTFPKQIKGVFENAGSSVSKFTLDDKDVTFRNNNYVTMYNNNVHCISSYIMNDNIPMTDKTGISSAAKSGVTSTYNTNVLNYATFGPTTMLETSNSYNIYPE